MEDNIRDMMEEIQDVVCAHFNDVEDTIGVLNTLPIVIALKKKIKMLENENRQLKILIKGIEEEKNIELEIVEVPKEDCSLENQTQTPSFKLSEDDDELDGISNNEEEYEDELELSHDLQTNETNDVIDTKIIRDI